MSNSILYAKLFDKLEHEMHEYPRSRYDYAMSLYHNEKERADKLSKDYQKLDSQMLELKKFQW